MMEERTMNRTLTRRSLLGLALVGAAGALAACGPAPPAATQAPSKPAGAEPPKPAESSKPTAPAPAVPAGAATKPAEAPKPAAAPGTKPGATVQFWFNGGRLWEDFYNQKLLPKYYADHPGVEVQLTSLASWDDQYNKLITATAGGAPPDFSRNKDFWTPDFAARGALEVMDPYLQKQADIAPEKYLKGAWSTTQWEGKTVALPLHVFARGIHLNDELFQKAGLADPSGRAKAPDTWDEYTQVAQKISKPDENVWGTMLYSYQGNEDLVNHFNYMLVAAGGRYMSEDNTKFLFNSPEGVETVEYQIDQIQKKACLPPGVSTNQAIESGRVGIWWGSAFNFPELARNAPKLKYSHSVAAKKKTRGGILRGNHMPLYRASKNKDAAWTFMSWHQQPDNAYLYAQTANYLMPRLELKDRPLYGSDENWKQVAKQFYDADNQPQPMFPGYVESSSKLGSHLMEAYLGKKSAKQALADGEKDALDVLRQFKR
jgi:multiple sugar transport system substrate-binding protein